MSKRIQVAVTAKAKMMRSDYIPAENDELFEGDDSDLDNLLSDDCLDSDKGQ
ncbi:hypothetical protein Plhal304r1_c029g0095481 [Plasmopara halstedii]